MAITGNEMPAMLNEMTPQSEANDRARRSVGAAAYMATPKPCAAKMKSHTAPSIVGMPHRQGKRR